MAKELEGVDMSRVRFTITPNAVWDTKEKQVVYKSPSSLDPELGRCKAFPTNTYRMPDGMSTAEFLTRKLGEGCYVVLYRPHNADGFAFEKEGMRLIKMATLYPPYW